MHVTYDNMIFGLQRSGGISVYWTELLRRADPASTIVVEPRNAERNVHGQAVANRLAVHLRSRLPVQIDRYLPVRSIPASSEIFHSSYYRVALGSVPSVVTVYDFVYERFRRGIPRLVHSAQKFAAVRGARRVICISESARRDLLARYGSRYEPRTAVVHLGVGEQFRLLTDARSRLIDGGPPFLRAGRPYLLFVGSRRHYKGFDAAVATAAKLPSYDLVVLGGEPWGAADAALTARHGSADRVHPLGTVAPADLPRWYGAAHALLYLSSYEGFGLPVLEAAMCGCPVIAQHTSAIPEVHGFHELLVPDLVVEEIVERVVRLESTEYRVEAVRASRTLSSTFTWDRCWSETQRVYELL